MSRHLAINREQFVIRSAGGEWSVAWYPPDDVPAGIPHGANALAVTADDGVVLIGNGGVRWGWPGGRPEGDETWEETLRREILEETCSTVTGARMLGFTRGMCLAGPEKGRTLVRSIWRAEVEVLAWEPRFEIAQRRIVPAGELLAHLTMEPGLEPIYHRAISDAGLMPS